MGEVRTWSVEDAVASHAHWWREAGLHTVTLDEAHGWREAPAAPFRQREPERPTAPRAAPPDREAGSPPPLQAPSAPAPSAPLPQTLPAFLDEIARDPSQPEAAWDGPAILPPAQTGARLLLIVEMPAAGATDAATLLDPGQRRFIDAMLASLGLAPADAPIAALATRRPPGGLLDEATLTRLAARMRHYLGLARPCAAIVLGDRTGRTLIGPQARGDGAELPMINHSGGTMPAIALAGPDLLMSRPAAKARSWQALRLLHGLLHGMPNR